MTKQNRLGGAIAELEAPLGRALQEFSPLTQWLDADLQLTYSNCGFATAVLRRCLERENIVTTRHRMDRNFTVNGQHQSESHVILTSGDDVIDPTYTQFFERIGLSSQLAQQFVDMRELLPDRKIAVFQVDEAEIFAKTFAARALSVRSRVREALGERELAFMHLSPSLLETSDGRTVETFYTHIWDIEQYSEYPEDSRNYMGEFVNKAAQSLQ